MAKQLYFYCAMEDLASIQQWLVERDILLLRPCIAEETEVVLNSVEDFATTHGWSLIYFTHSQHFDRIAYRSTSSGLKYLEESSRGYTIEFRRPQVDRVRRKIARARFYVQTGVDTDFETFATHIYRSFKRRFLVKYPNAEAAWVTQAAAALLMEGFEPVAHL